VVLISHDIAGVVEVADRIHIHRLGRCPGVADDVGAELLVVGIHHRSAVGKVLRGSNAQCILLTPAARPRRPGARQRLTGRRSGRWSGPRDPGTDGRPICSPG
jgi:hypothetical protein